MTLVIDADTHIAEPPQMWEHLDPDFYDRRPLLIQIPGDTVYGHFNAMWLIDGQHSAEGRRPSQQYPRHAHAPGLRPEEHGRHVPRHDRHGPALQPHGLHGHGRTGRLSDALSRLVDGRPHPGGRPSAGRTTVTWPASRDRSEGAHPLGVGAAAAGHRRHGPRDALQRPKHGAVGLFFRGIEKDLMLDDPYFFPVYEEAQAMGLTICVHQGQGAPALNNLVDIRRSSSFTHGRLPPLSAFRNLVANRIPEEFPTAALRVHRDRRFVGALRLPLPADVVHRRALAVGPTAVRAVQHVGLLRGRRGPPVPRGLHRRGPHRGRDGLWAPR